MPPAFLFIYFMKSNYVLFVIASILFLGSCKKEEEKAGEKQSSNGIVSIQFDNKVGNDDIQLNQMVYTNPTGNLYSVSMLKYYVSNIELHKIDGASYKAANYELIDVSDPSSLKFDIGELSAGQYDSITFYIGVDQLKNHNGAQDGDLDVSKGMFWTWNTGYIFFKHEGQYKNSSDQTKPLVFHYATDAAYVKVKLPIDLNINGAKTIRMGFDLNSVYSTPVNIDFNVDNNRQSTSAADATWLGNLKGNLSDAFKVLEVK